MDKSGFGDLAAVGILTGGGSLMPGITEQCSQSLGLKQVRRGLVQRGAVIEDEEFFEPRYSTAVSLVAYAAKRDLLSSASAASQQSSGKSPVLKFFKMLKNSDLFGG